MKKFIAALAASTLLAGCLNTEPPAVAPAPQPIYKLGKKGLHCDTQREAYAQAYMFGYFHEPTIMEHCHLAGDDHVVTLNREHDRIVAEVTLNGRTVWVLAIQLESVVPEPPKKAVPAPLSHLPEADMPTPEYIPRDKLYL